MSFKQFIVALCSITISLTAGEISVKKYKAVSDNDLECIAYINEKIFLGGDDEQLYSSADMGETWEEMEMKRVNGDIDVIMQTSDGTVILAGGTWDESFILVSTDKGAKWDRVWDDDEIAIKTLVEMKNGTILAIGDEDEYVRSSMDYETWKEFDRPWKKSDKKFKEIDVHDSYRFKNGDVLLVGQGSYSMCYNKMLEKRIFSSGNYNESVNYTKLHFLNDTDGFMGSAEGVIYKTNDKGKTWTPVYKGSKYVSCIDFNDNGVGVAVGHEGLLVTSFDSGATWNESKSDVEENLNYVLVLEDGRFYAVGDEGTRISISVK